jgi:ADP-L-glycero-D-manno-heptose 6-epimerase
MIILTGGAGFIGTNTLITLNELGYRDILVVDHVGTTRKWENLVGHVFRDYVQKDCLWDWLARYPDENIEAVIHLGACTDTMETDFEYLFENNVRYSQRLWQICAERNVTFIYASSAATYGDGSRGFSDGHDKTHEYRPINPYGFSKHLFDLWALGQSRSPHRWYGLKFFNVYGPFEDHKGRMASVARFAIPQVLETGKIRLFKSHRPGCGDGEQKRDFVYVQDVVDIMLHLLDFPAPSGLYNAGSGTASTFNSLAAAIFEAVGKPARIEYFDMPATLRDSYQYFTQADMQKLLDTGYPYQASSLTQGVARYYQWIMDRRGGAPIRLTDADRLQG